MKNNALTRVIGAVLLLAAVACSNESTSGVWIMMAKMPDINSAFNGKTVDKWQRLGIVKFISSGRAHVTLPFVGKQEIEYKKRRKEFNAGYPRV